MTYQKKPKVQARKPRRLIEKAVTYISGSVALALEGEGMWRAIETELHITSRPLLIGFFTVFSGAIIASTLRARRSMIAYGTTGIDGKTLFFLAAASGVIASTTVDNTGGLLLRLAAPAVAAWMFHRSVTAEHEDAAGKRHQIPWKRPVEWLAVRLGLAQSEDVAVAERLRRRRVERIARLAFDIGAAKKPSARKVRKLNRSVLGLRAAEDRQEVRLRVATMYQAAQALTPQAVAGLAPWTDEEIPGTEIHRIWDELLAAEIPAEPENVIFGNFEEQWANADRTNNGAGRVLTLNRQDGKRPYRSPEEVRRQYEKVLQDHPELVGDMKAIAAELQYGSTRGLVEALKKTEPKEES